MQDLRSDTVTRPSAGMLAAMQSARVGYDVWRDDPTVNGFEAALAERLGKEAALFFPTGTQSNLAGLMAQCGRGDEYIVGQEAHTYRYEGGGAAVLGSIQPQPIQNASDGTLPLQMVGDAVKPIDPHFARTRLIALENTIHGRVLPTDYVASVAELASAKGLALHLDGARMWNAAVSLGRPPRDLCLPFDSVSVCFSKGLGAPAGSALVASQDVIDRARRWRKVLGGGMRQAGYLAAACWYSLDHNVERLAEDHEKAAHLARRLSELFAHVDYSGTNMVFLRLPDDNTAQELARHLGNAGVLIPASRSVRLVTHLDVSWDGIEMALQAFRIFADDRRPDVAA